MYLEQLENKLSNLENKYSKNKDKVHEYYNEIHNALMEYYDKTDAEDFEYYFSNIADNEDVERLMPLGYNPNSLYYWIDIRTVGTVDYDMLTELSKNAIEFFSKDKEHDFEL